MSKVSIGNSFSTLIVALLLATSSLATTGALAQATPAASTTPDANGAPDELVKNLSTDVLNSIKADKSLQSGDFAKLQQLVDEKILPYVNFEKMTQLAVGRGWRQATPEQREALSKEFRTLLVRTYA